MVFDSGVIVFKGCFIQLRIEVEIVFVMKDVIGGVNLICVDVLVVIDYVVLLFEIFDICIVWQDFEIGVICKVYDIISDNVVNVGVVLGEV